MHLVRSSRFALALALATAAAGCPSATTPGADTGIDVGARDTGVGAVDAGGADGGTDAGSSSPDTGTDAAVVTGDAGDDASIAADGGACSGGCGGDPRMCCAGTCVYTYNDSRNCGSCGHVCADNEYCTGGSCVQIPCTTKCGGTCCGGQCCAAGEICCDPAGPVSGEPVCTPPTAAGSCPAGCAPLCTCASPDTRIATPSGERAIADLAVGDLVYSAEGGALVAVPLAAVHRTWVGGDHRVVRVVLDTGRVLEISPGHPTADGRFFSDLRPGDLLDGARVVEAELVPYAHDYTYDVLPASQTATYVAGGVLIGSTMAPSDAPIALDAP
ncbi:MAG: hypothetical protein U0234_19055 [Sandaracinus sp.]